MKKINSCVQLLSEWLGEEAKDEMHASALLKKYCFKYTQCGCSLEIDGTGVHVSGYVDGVDWEMPVHTLKWGEFAKKDFNMAVSRADEQGVDTWNDTHGCADCGGEDPDTGYVPINEFCGSCDGEGIWF